MKTVRALIINGYCHPFSSGLAETLQCQGFSGDSDSKKFACNVGGLASIPRLGRSPGGGNGNHSSILAWKIPWMEEPGRLQYTESQRVRHD